MFETKTVLGAEMHQPETLPTRAEAIATMAVDGGFTAYEGDRQVRIPGPTQSGNVIRCHICDAPAGQVQLMKVEALGQTGYVCKAGDCAGQRNKAFQRILTKKTGKATRRRTSKSR